MSDEKVELIRNALLSADSIEYSVDGGPAKKAVANAVPALVALAAIEMDMDELSDRAIWSEKRALDLTFELGEVKQRLSEVEAKVQQMRLIGAKT